MIKENIIKAIEGRAFTIHFNSWLGKEEFSSDKFLFEFSKSIRVINKKDGFVSTFTYLEVGKIT